MYKHKHTQTQALFVYRVGFLLYSRVEFRRLARDRMSTLDCCQRCWACMADRKHQNRRHTGPWQQCSLVMVVLLCCVWRHRAITLQFLQFEQFGSSSTFDMTSKNGGDTTCFFVFEILGVISKCLIPRVRTEHGVGLSLISLLRCTSLWFDICLGHV